MASKSLKSLLKKLRRDLDWPVLERPHDAPVIRIVSNTTNKSHVIFMPDKLHNRSNDLDYLHELGHAYFAEQVHPLFSANSHFAPHKNKQQYVNLIPALNAACDWFIGHWQMEVAPKELLNYLKESLPVVEEVLNDPNAPPLEVILDASMLIAQAIHYLDEPIDCGGALKLAVDAFLSIPPDEPTAENCILLVNRLMATYTDHRAKLVNNGELSVWHLILPNEESNAEMSDSVKPGEDS